MMSSWFGSGCGEKRLGQPKVVATSSSASSLLDIRSFFANTLPLDVSADLRPFAVPLRVEYRQIPTSRSSLWMLFTATRRISPPTIRRSLPAMLATSTRPAVAGPNGKATYHTVTALKRWSCDDKELPPVSEIKAIHIYDFDNTRTSFRIGMRLASPLTL